MVANGRLSVDGRDVVLGGGVMWVGGRNTSAEDKTASDSRTN